MLIDFTVTNFRSYRDEATLSMVAGDECFARDSLLDIPSATDKLLPLTAIYGANASGKSTLIKALARLQELVKRGGLPMYEPFLMDEDSSTEKTSYEISFVSRGKAWRYSLSFRHSTLEEERLECCTGGEELIYERQGTNVRLGDVVKKALEPEVELLVKMLINILKPHYLFLAHALPFDFGGLHESLSAVHSWLTDTLQIVDAGGLHRHIGELLLSHKGEYARALAYADTGITGLHTEEVSPEEMRLLPSVIPSVLRHEGGQEKAYRFKATHQCLNGKSIHLSFTDESEGTLRFLHMLPALLEGKRTPYVYVIDELDRSLHSKLPRSLLEQQRALAREQVPQQLIFTTHDTTFIDRELLRMDELWVVEKDREHCSHLISFAEYDNIDKLRDLQQSYLDGKMGGIPSIIPLLIDGERSDENDD